MAQVNYSSTSSGENDATLADLTCLRKFSDGTISKELTCLLALNIAFCVTAIFGNSLILLALHKETSLHAPSKLLFRTLATTDLCVGLFVHPLSAATWISELQKDFEVCRYTSIARFLASYILCSVSLLTTTAISMDRLLALSLRLRYRQFVTLNRAYMVVTIFWVFSIVGTVVSFLKGALIIVSNITISVCLLTSLSSYLKIFFALRFNKTEVNKTRRSERVPLNIVLYRKTVYGALLVQLSLVVCYLPYGIAQVVFTAKKDLTSFTVLVWGLTGTLVYFNSSLNPILYCWKIREVKQAVKETVRRICTRRDSMIC